VIDLDAVCGVCKSACKTVLEGEIVVETPLNVSLDDVGVYQIRKSST